MRLVDCDIGSLFLLPMRGKRRVDLLIELARDVIGGVEDRRLGVCRDGRDECEREYETGPCEDAPERHG